MIDTVTVDIKMFLEERSTKKNIKYNAKAP
jgi:hypothetical protein